jgi:hypothetical protein
MADPAHAKAKRVEFWFVLGMIAMIALPAIPTLHTVRVSAFTDVIDQHPSPCGYTTSLLLFLFPIFIIGFWFIPHEKLPVSRKSFWITIAILFPLGVILDFFFASAFLLFPNKNATMGIQVPALEKSVPVEEYIFYLTGFLAVLLIYIWLDEYWLAAYSVPGQSDKRTEFHRLVRFHPYSVFLAVLLIAVGIILRRVLEPHAPGFPGYFTFLVLAALTPSAALFPEARPVINWRAFSLTAFIILLTSMLWEATLALPYGWWDYQHPQMIGLYIRAWHDLPIEAVFVWLAVTYMTVIIYEIVKRWKASGKPARRAFLGEMN